MTGITVAFLIESSAEGLWDDEPAPGRPESDAADILRSLAKRLRKREDMQAKLDSVRSSLSTPLDHDITADCLLDLVDAIELLLTQPQSE